AACAIGGHRWRADRFGASTRRRSQGLRAWCGTMKGELNMRTLVKNGRIVTAVDAYNADILIVDGTIAAIGRDLSAPEADVIDAAGRMVIPGGVDPDTHLDNPSGHTVTRDYFLPVISS